jgi:hypothetical protein
MNIENCQCVTKHFIGWAPQLVYLTAIRQTQHRKCVQSFRCSGLRSLTSTIQYATHAHTYARTHKRPGWHYGGRSMERTECRTLPPVSWGGVGEKLMPAKIGLPSFPVHSKPCSHCNNGTCMFQARELWNMLVAIEHWGTVMVPCAGGRCFLQWKWALILTLKASTQYCMKLKSSGVRSIHETHELLCVTDIICENEYIRVYLILNSETCYP